MRVAVAILLCAALATPVRAGSDADERARGHYEIGLGLYRLGDFPGALKEFAAGYELAHKPGFLLNLGQTYRKLGELREARDMYRQFLADTRLDDPSRPQAQKMLAELEEAVRSQPPPPPTEPPPPLVVTPPPQQQPAPLPVAAVTPPPSLQTSAPPRRPRRALRYAGLAAGIAGIGLIGGGIGTAVAADSVAHDLNALDRAGGAFDPSKDRAYTLDRTLSAVFFSLGGVLAAGGAVMLVVSAR